MFDMFDVVVAQNPNNTSQARNGVWTDSVGARPPRLQPMWSYPRATNIFLVLPP